MGLWSEICGEWRFYRYAEEPTGRLAALRRPGFWLMANYRFGRWAQGVRVPVAGKLLRLGYALQKVWISSLTGVDIRIGAQIGRRFNVHTWFGTVIADGVKIGDDCTINSGVCLVHSANSKGSGTPTVGNAVRLGVGCKILGGVSVGDFSIIGANAVVTRDVQRCSVAVGIPAQSRPVPKEYIDEYFDPQHRLRKAGLLPEGLTRPDHG